MNYTPLLVDLTPFRAGTIWHTADGKAYAIERATLDDSCRVVHSLTQGGGGFDKALVKLHLVLTRMDSMDHLPPEHDLDVWLRERDPVVVAGQAWQVTAWSTGLPWGVEINLTRAWWADPEGAPE